MADEMFRPPVNRAMRVLDRSFFRRQIPLSAARVLDNRNITVCRAELQQSKDILRLERCATVQTVPGSSDQSSKCILLRPELDEAGRKWPWTAKVSELEDRHLVDVIPFKLDLDYDYWTYHDVATAILPEGGDEEIPSGFTLVGHVAHLNLRDKYLPYKTIIGEVLLDKNPAVKTVINKVDDVGEENEYRTFKYEVLAGPDDMNVEIREADCTFRFNYAKVYWNSRLNTEHERIVEMFREGDAVCDVMAGIGPFAVPAGKKRVFVWANDLNPDSHASLLDAIERNKVSQFVRPSNLNGHDFIRSATSGLLRSEHTTKIELTKKKRRGQSPPGQASQKVEQKIMKRPKTFSHYVMNLPASAIEFLPAFIGLYSDPEDRELLPPDFKMPMVHVHCFSTKSDDNEPQKLMICEEISKQLGYVITPETPETQIWDVRDVAPNKRMFCASFRLPKEVAFRSRS